MVTKRIIGLILIKDRWAVQSIGFNRYLPVGSPVVLAEFLNNWGIDEIIVLDMFAGRNNRMIDLDLLKDLSEKCYVPVAVGGGIKSIEEIYQLIRMGADKVVINSQAFRTPHLISQAAEVFGDQCVVVSIDAKRSESGGYKTYMDGGTCPSGIAAIDAALQAESCGAGEVFINSIDRDGTKSGYETELVKDITGRLKIPVIACGGAGHPVHFLDIFQQTGVAAAAAGNFFTFCEHSVNITKAYLKKSGLNVRMDTYATYEDFDFNPDGRLAKRHEEYLDDLRFKFYPKEII